MKEQGKMTDWAAMERDLTKRLELGRRPVAVSYLKQPPAGVQPFAGTMPSGCSFWRLAAQGRVFSTVAADHYNCPVGSYTHGIEMPPERAGELDQTLGMMFEARYLKPDDVPKVFRLAEPPGAVVYAPLALAPAPPDVVVVACPPRQAMLLNEAALRAGARADLPALERPTCMALPAAMARGAATSLGCIGNRIYTDLGDDEMYVMLPGRKLAAVLRELATVTAANAAVAGYARTRRQQLASE
jgi:uncharacterized protein (DUF169 family)